MFRDYNLLCNQTNAILNLAFEIFGHLRGHSWRYDTSSSSIWDLKHNMETEYWSDVTVLTF